MSYITNDSHAPEETRYLPATTIFILAFVMLSAIVLCAFATDPNFFFPHRALDHRFTIGDVKLPLAMKQDFD